MTLNSRPAGVLLAATLNFVLAGLLFCLSGLLLVLGILGTFLGWQSEAIHRAQEVMPEMTALWGLYLMMVTILLVGLAAGSFFLSVGFWVLKGRGWAWYLQVAISFAGLLFFPLGTLFSVILIALFFQTSVRQYFKV